MSLRIAILAGILICMSAVLTTAQIASNEIAQKQIVMTKLPSMPLAFTENRGQWDEKAFFKAEAGGATFWFCKDEVVYRFVRDTKEPLEDKTPPMHDMPDKFNHPKYKKEQMVLRAKFSGANPNPEIMTKGRLSHNNNYFLGNDPSKWAADVPNYSSVSYKDIYPGIDLVYHGNASGMKYDFIVSPGSDISQIKIKYDGAKNLAITANGELEATTSFGLVHENIPEVYQEINGSRVRREGRYKIRNKISYGFEIDYYNPNYPLIIDPELVYSTYLGGSNGDYGYSIAVDGANNIYVTGATNSDDFPIQNPNQIFQGNYDVYVTKFLPSGDSLVYSTYLGGSNTDVGYCITVDTKGSVYVTGRTSSPDFPIVGANPPLDSLSGGFDTFVAKLPASGNFLIYSCYLGGTFEDVGWGIAVDKTGSAYVTGYTGSPDFPTQNPYQTYQGYSDAFITKLSPMGEFLVYSTCLGGNALDYGLGIAVDDFDNAYVAGTTFSTNFPTQNPYQTYQGSCDAFITKLSFSGDSLVYSTYLGGNDGEWCHCVAINRDGSAYVTGRTYSSNFPVVGPYQMYRGNGDVFISKLSPSGNSLIYSTFLGGSDEDWGFDIAVDGGDSAYVTGITSSSNFPTLHPHQYVYGGGYCDAFMAQLSALGNSLVYSTYLGGNGQDRAWGIAIDGNGSTYITGNTDSPNFPVQNPFQATYSGNNDAFVAKFASPTGIDDDNFLPSGFSLSQNYPNPFNAVTIIEYSLPEPSDVTIDIYDILGRKVETLIDKHQPAGYHWVIWQADEFSSGVYFYKVQAGNYTETKKMVLLK